MQKNKFSYLTPGIPDSAFIRGKVPMTKEEVRIVTLAKMQLQADSIVVDVGAGTGSIAIEATRLCPQGTVYAIERKPEALELIKQNSDQFGLPLQIIAGEAVERLAELDHIDRIVVGGSGGTLGQIIQMSHDRLNPNGRIVINAITIETAYKAIEAFKTLPFDEVEVISITAARGRFVGNSTLMDGLNPVYIISAEKS